MNEFWVGQNKILGKYSSFVFLRVLKEKRMSDSNKKFDCYGPFQGIFKYFSRGKNTKTTLLVFSDQINHCFVVLG